MLRFLLMTFASQKTILVGVEPASGRSLPPAESLAELGCHRPIDKSLHPVV